MNHSSFRGAHQGTVFTIRFESYPNGYTARLEIDGLPPREYSDKCWRDREEAKIEVSNDAYAMIEKMTK